MKNLLLEISAVDPTTGLTTPIRMAGALASGAGTNLNGYEWKPAIVTGPTFDVSIWGSGQPQPATVSYGQITFITNAVFNNLDVPKYAFEGSLATLWYGDDGAPFASYRQIWSGALGPLVRDSDQLAHIALLGPENRLNKQLLSASYQGTGNAEGPASLLGTLKPFTVGACTNVEPVLVDPVYWIYQVHGYGSCAINSVFENQLTLGSPASTVSDFASLKALTMANGTWAACPALGMFRIANTPKGKITADVGTTATVGSIVSTLIQAAGVSTGSIDSTVTGATGNNGAHYSDQTLIIDAVSDMAFQSGRYLIADSTGKFCLGSHASSKTAIPLNSDRSTTPLVQPDKIVQQPTTLPAYRVRIGHTRVWSVASITDISPAIADLGTADAANALAASNAQNAANQAQSDATLANSRLASMANDNVLDRTDKLAVVQQYEAIVAEKTGLNSSATGLGITTENTNYNSAYTALQTYLTGLSPAYNDTTQDTTIVAATFKQKFNDYYAARQTLMNKVAAVAATRANGLDPVTGVVTNRVPSNLVGIAPGNIYLDPNFADQSLITVIGSNINFVTATQTITPAGVATADTSSAADLVTMGVTKATKSLGNGTSGRWRSPMYQIPGPGTYVAALRLLYKAGGNFNGSLGLTFYDKSGTQLPQATTTIAYTGLTSDLLQDVTVTGTAPAGAFYAALNPNFGGSATPFYMALPTIRAVTTPGIANLGDTSNMVPDADFLDPAITWKLPAQWSVLPNATAGEGAGVNKISIPTAVSATASTAPVACTPGKTVLHSFFAKKTVAGGSSDYCLVGVWFYNAAGALVSGGQQYFLLYATVADGRNQTIFKAPAGTAFVRYFIYTPGNFTTTWELSEPIIRFATVSGDSLIGSNGTTVLTDSAIVTNLGTAAYIANQGAGATANTLAQLDAAASTKLTGIATGATNTTTYSQATAPTSPNNGDIWNDTSTNPMTIKVRVAGVWVIGATYVTGTNQITDNAGLGTTATWTGVVGTGKPADNATKNIVTTGSTAPSSPVNGDIWNDTSTTPATVKLRVGGAWVVGSNYVTNTNQVTDGAGLGTTAIWTGVTGTGKPADNATVNVFTTGSTAPSSPNNGDAWNDTSTNPPTLKLRVAGAWVVASNYVTNTNQVTDGAGLGTTATWSGVGSRPANLAGLTGAEPIRNNEMSITAAGQLLTGGTSLGQVTIGGLGYSGALNATKNLVTYSSTAPSSPSDGDIWIDTTATPYVVKLRASGTWQTGIQTGADITAANQVQVTYTTSKTISADYTGVIASGVLPTTVPAPKVTLGGVDVTQSNNVQYAIVNDTGGCAGNVTVDTTNGSATKGVQVIGTGYNSSGGYQLQVTVNGYALPLISVSVTKKLADPPSGGGGGGSGGSTSASMSTGGSGNLGSTSYVQVGSTLANLTVASGKTAYLSGGDDYDCYGGGTGKIVNVILSVKWQYSVAGANAWTDVGSVAVGSSATYDSFTGDTTSGSVNCSASVAPSAGSYDFRLMANRYSGTTSSFGGFTGSGLWRVNIT